MRNCQAAVLQDVPALGRYVFFNVADAQAPVLRAGLARLAQLADGTSVLVGIGSQLAQALDAQLPGLREFVALCGPGVSVPSTPSALCCWLRGDDRGDLIHLTRALQRALQPAFKLECVIDAFRHGRGPNGHGRDLTGYEDGTENPSGEQAEATALMPDGSTCMAVQQWQHDLDAFEALDTAHQDDLVGRRRSDNEEIEDAPASAHVKRVAQEDFEPEAFVLRRSMPWVQGERAGLVFVAFGRSFDAFEAQLRRMVGRDDGIVDALFGISRPIQGAHFWCPPVLHGKLDLRRLGLVDGGQA